MEDLHEGGLSPRSPLCTSKSEITAHSLDVFKVHEQILDPLGSSSAYGDALSWLIVLFWWSVHASSGSEVSDYSQCSQGLVHPSILVRIVTRSE